MLPTTAVIGGFFGQSADGRRYPRPPAWLTLVALAMMAGLVLMTVLEGATSRYWLAAGIVLLGTIAVPAAVFLGARALAVWLHPRLLLYSQLGAYLRVMWVPMGSLAIGYLIIIIVFAGFYGMLARFSPESFANVGEDTGIITWVSFAFFTGVGADYTHIVPVSTGARALVGAQLIPTIGWVLVMFAAVMAYLQPQLQRIARRDRP